MTEPPHRIRVRVYYEDTDFSGVVYHASYLRFLERGRTEMLRTAGVEQAAMVDENGIRLAFAVRHLGIDFLSPARMDDLLDVDTRIVERGGASLVVAQAICRAATAIVRAEVKIALVGEGRARRFPAALAARLSGGQA